ncbi:hypothetical protein DEIPH_ctg040orf0019 [Deinococcus phoenicis]|uniref:SPOR domain-containing protein n=1 Tax=Deinococcus phoenicis TaxID=1476583 RepID=A0A016QNK2_9DEIO|nr:SPOR domain-containing protein [Deinococcus phoenicis]EYB67457.1 hypothetical protein DEIPH_ctg040orf0019 [Deinococcus phoenicis]
MSRAESRPRRWPDLLIGLLVLLLLAGFALLLLGQRRPQLAQAPAPVTEPAPAPVIPGAPGTEIVPDHSAAPTPVASSPAPDSAGTEQVGGANTAAPAQTADPGNPPATPATEPATARPAQPDPAKADAGTSTPETPPSETAAPAPTPPASSAPASASGEVPVVPAEPIPAAPSAPPAPPVTLPDPPTNPVQPVPSQATAGQPSGASGVPPRAGGAVATSEQRTPLRSDYRISLGTFGSVGTAQSRTQGVRDLGYTVYPIDLGSQAVAQVGPFADEATARQALADIQRAYPSAVLYPPRNRSLGAAGAESTESAPSRPASPAQAPAAQTASSEAPAAETAKPTAAPVPSGPVYLQVGAFDRVESAQTLVGQLREQGYAPTVNAPEGRKVSVLIGPFSGAAVTSAEEKLDANGFDHFRVR